MDAEEFGQLIKKNRRELKLTQAELAERCGTGERFIVDLEAGKVTTQLGKALTVATELGIIISDKKPTILDEDKEIDIGWMPKI